MLASSFMNTDPYAFQHLTSHQSPDNQTAADSGILQQYKDLIREQDQRINEITQANLYLQQELSSSRQQAEELASSVQALQDQNALLRFDGPLKAIGNRGHQNLLKFQ
jgi:peptidoglycan hydrolase CwlO-like protein